jgi:acyl-CoA hydrolase
VNLREEYEKKLTDIDKVLSIFQDNWTIVVGMTPMEPKVFLRNLHRTQASGLEIYTCLNTEPYEFVQTKSISIDFTTILGFSDLTTESFQKTHIMFQTICTKLV